MMRSAPARAVELAFGLADETALDRVQGATDAEHELALAANQALWPATWGYWFLSPMGWATTTLPLLASSDLTTLRNWFTDFVRAEGPLPTLRIGRHPYGILPVSTFEKRTGGAVLDHLENTVMDIFGLWQDKDAVPLLDPDASDVVPDEKVEEQASDVGAIYGATPHIRELRLRPVDNTYDELNDLYSIRVGTVGLLCSAVPTEDGDFATEEELENYVWYEAFTKREDNLRGARGVQGQIDAWHNLSQELDQLPGVDQQEEAALNIRKFIDRDLATSGELCGDPIGIVVRHSGRVADGQPYLGDLGARDELGTDQAPRLYTAGYGDEGTEIPVGVLVAPGDDEDSVDELEGWLGDLHDAVVAWIAGGPRPPYEVTKPYPLLRQMLQVAAAKVADAVQGAALQAGLARLRDLVRDRRSGRDSRARAAAPRHARPGDLPGRRLDDRTGHRPAGIRTENEPHRPPGRRLRLAREPRAPGGEGEPGLHPRPEPRPRDDRRGACGADGAHSAPRTADRRSLSTSPARQIRAARSLVEGVRSGQELGRVLGARFERMLHDRNLDRYIDDVRKAVLRGSGQEDRPATRIVDGLLVARAFTEGIELTDLEQDVLAELDTIVSGDSELASTVDDLVAELDAVADVLFSQAVHALLRGDAGVAAPTLAATGSADSGLPAIDFPETLRGGRLLTQRVLAVFGQTVPGAWPGAGTSVLSAAEPRLESWVGDLLGLPANVLADVTSAGKTRRVSLGTLGLAALDAVYGVDGLAGLLLEAQGMKDGVIAAGRPADLPDDKLSFDEFLTLARAVRELLGRIRPLGDVDLTTDPEVADSRDALELATRLKTARARVPASDPRLVALLAHEKENPGATADQVIERLHILTVEPVPILPLLGSGVPAPLAGSFAARRAASAQSQSRIAAWLAQAARVRRDLEGFLDAVQLAELASLRSLLTCMVAQSPEEGGAWAGDHSPEGSGAVMGWCNVTGQPPEGPVAGFVVDAWTETIPAVTATSGIAVHFDRPSAAAPNAVLLAVTRGEESFDIDVVRRCVRNALTMAQFRGLSPDTSRPWGSQFLPAAFLPDDVVVLAEEGEDV